MAGELARLRQEIKRLETQVQFDTLTGCLTFGYLMTTLEMEMERTRRSDLPTGLIMIDIDHFKRINDTLGHESGNQALRGFGRLIRTNIRRIDIAGRYGGEEFVVILPATDMAASLQIAERLRENIAAGPLSISDREVRLTASFGVSDYHGRTLLTAADFIARADRFLLEAKNRGRNQVRHDPRRIQAAATALSEAERGALFARCGR